MQTNGTGTITGYLSTGSFADLPDADTVTPLDLKQITLTSVNPTESCTAANISGVNGLVISLIPLSNTGIYIGAEHQHEATSHLYKIAGTVKADIFG